ncbi:MAG: apolipoprotein N-acyltransferase [Paracoccaceae bacterium]|nr:apolipoprotein N-acyltransferase [Paracoccaceae bacterium]
MAAARRLGRAVAPAFGLGLILATGQAPLSFSLVGFLALVGLFALVDRAPTLRAAALTGWAGGAGYFAGGLFWIVEPFFVDPLRHGWMAPFALVLLPSGLGLFWGAAFGLAARLAGGWRRLLLAAVLLAAAETSRAFVLTGFPWALVGYTWIDAPQMQIAAVIGPHGLTLATTLAAALGAVCIGRPRAWLAAPALAALAVAGAGLWGQARLAAPEPAATGVTLRVVQPNAEQSLKWDPVRAEEFLHRLLTATSAAPEGAQPDLTIWPETAVPYLLNGSESLLAEINARAGGRPVAFGIVRRDGARLFNSLAVTAPGGAVTQVYDKRHLVPFGEYMPLGELFGAVGIQGLAASHGGGFSAGPGPVLLDFGRAGRALALICYEAIFPQHLFAPERPDWVLQVTNDAWFGEISGPYQHLAQARLRAVEQGLPVIRAANTGISAVIDAKGRVLERLGLGQQGFLDAALPPALPPTPYAGTGDWPALAALLALALVLALPRSRNSH